MKIATWNVNSLNVRLPRVLAWLAAAQPDVALPAGNQDGGREVSAPGNRRRRLRGALRRAAHVQRRRAAGARRRRDRRGRRHRAPGFRRRAEARDRRDRSAASRIVDFYVPNGEAVDSDKYRYKLDWCRAATALPRRRARAAPGARGGRRLQHRAGGSRRPRSGSLARPGAVLGAGARGVPRLARARSRRTASACSTSPKRRSAGGITGSSRFRRTAGCASTTSCCRRRSPARCTACRIDRNARKGERPSDHAPVIAELGLNADGVSRGRRAASPLSPLPARPSRAPARARARGSCA